MILHHWTRWPPCPYMVKKSPTPEPRKLWGWILVYSIADSRTTTFIQMMTLGDIWPFHGKVRFGSLCIYIGKILKKSFSQNILKTNGQNLQCMIQVANPFSYNQNFVPQGYLPLPLGYIHVEDCIIFKHLLLWNSLTNFHQISHRAFC